MKVESRTGDDHARKHRTMIYLDTEALASLDEIRAFYRRRHGRSTDRSELIRTAVRRLHADLVASDAPRGES